MLEDRRRYSETPHLTECKIWTGDQEPLPWTTNESDCHTENPEGDELIASILLSNGLVGEFNLNKNPITIVHVPYYGREQADLSNPQFLMTRTWETVQPEVTAFKLNRYLPPNFVFRKARLTEKIANYHFDGCDMEGNYF